MNLKRGCPKRRPLFLFRKIKAGTPLLQGWCGGGGILPGKMSELPKVAQKGFC